MRAALRCIGMIAAGLVLAAGLKVMAQTPVGDVELIKSPPRAGVTHLPEGAPRPVLYYLGKAHMPSCGLLPAEGGKTAASIIPILERDADVDFPYCVAVTEAGAFEFNGAPGYVFKYSQRDTREDTSEWYFFILRQDGQWHAQETLNGQRAPKESSIQAIAGWGKSWLVSQANEKEGYAARKQDSIVTDRAFLNLSQNAAAGRCKVVVDFVSSQSGFGPVTTPCQAVLATTALTGSKASYFIVLTEGENHQARGQIFAVEGKTVHEAADLEQRLQREIDSRKILAVKSALRSMVEAH